MRVHARPLHLIDLLRLLWHRRLISLGCVTAGVACGLAWPWIMPRMYVSHATLMVPSQPQAHDGLAGALDDAVLPGPAAHMALLSSHDVLTAALRREADADEDAMASRVQRMSANTNVVEKGRGSGVIQVSYADTVPARARSRLQAALSAYDDRLRTLHAAAIARHAASVDQRLPEVQLAFDANANALAAMEASTGGARPDALVRRSLDQLAQLDNAIDRLHAREAELAARYTGQHPDMEATRRQREALERQRSELRDRIGRMPAAEVDVRRIARHLEVAGRAYERALAEAYRVRGQHDAAWTGVHVLQPPTPPLPSGPGRWSLGCMGAALGCLTALMLGVGRHLRDHPRGQPRTLRGATA